MSETTGALYRARYAAPSIAAPGRQVVILELSTTAPEVYRVFEHEGDLEAPEAISHKFTVEQALSVAARAVRGDRTTLADARATVLLGAALLALCGPSPNPGFSMSITPPRAADGDL